MAGIVQLAAGGSAQAPSGAVSIRLTTTAQVQLVLVGEDGRVIEPHYRASAVEAVFVPGVPVLVTARTTSGHPFASGTRVGVALRSLQGADGEIVRPPAEVGGHQSVPLVRIDSTGLISDALVGAQRSDGEGLWARPWMKAGSYAYRVNHQTSTAAGSAWVAVVDGSASMLVSTRREALGRFLETLIGIVATAFGEAPTALLAAAEPPRDAVSALEADEVDWGTALGELPAPWARVTHAVEAAGRVVERIVVVLDGVPVDYRELTALARAGSQRLLVVVLGRSRHGIGPADRPDRFWDEELAALDDLAALDNVTLVSTRDLAGVDAVALADALFPVGGGAL